MSSWAETEGVVSQLRELIGLTGYPSDRHIWLVSAALADRLTVVVSPCLRSYTLCFPDGRAIITISERLSETAKGRVLLEELIHACIEAKRPLPRFTGKDRRSAARLVLLDDAKAEREVSDAMLCWYLPSELMAFEEHDAERQIAADAGVPQDWVRRRLELWLR